MKIIFVLMFCPLLLWGQNFVYLDIGAGSQGKESLPVVDFDLGTGFVLKQNLNCFGGFRMSKYFLDLAQSNQNEDGVTSSILSLNLYLGASNYFNIIKFDEKAIFRSFGFFPEIRYFFNPFLTRKIKYEQDGELVLKIGNYHTQSSFGFGGGIFFKTSSGLIALKIELSTIDPFEILRDLDYGKKKMPFSKGKQFLISLRLSGF